MERKGNKVEEILAALGTRANGIVDRKELLAAGVTPQQIQVRLRNGLLIPAFRGVYRVGHAAPDRDAHYLAAVRACAADALLVGLAAAHVHVLVKGAAPTPEVAARSSRPIEGIRKRRLAIPKRDICVVRNIPLTTVPRTLVDIAPGLTIGALARACHEAGVKYRVGPRHVEAVLAHYPNAPGAKNLRLVMSGDAKVLLSKLERAFIAFLKAHSFPLPITNRVADGRRVDCRWPGHLTVELDSFRFHNSRYSWEQGLQREREARNRGEEFRRFSWADVFEDQTYMLAELAKLLPQRGRL